MDDDPIRLLGLWLLKPKAGRRKSYVAVWRDPATGRQKQKALRTVRQRDAERLARDIARHVLAGTYARPLTFREFSPVYLAEGLLGKSRGHREGWEATAKHVRDFRPTVRLDQMDTAWVRRWQAWLGQKVSEGSVAAYSTRLRAALRWAVEEGLLGQAPNIKVRQMPSRGRPLLVGELEKMQIAADRIRPKDAAAWKRFMAGLFYSGLRLGELRRLSWDADAPIRLEASMPPVVHLARGSHKGKRRETRTMIPEFWELVKDQPRKGYVFPLGGRRRQQMSPKRISRLISEMGEKIVTDPGRHATAHDLRRGFGRFLQVKYGATIREVQEALGHADVRTTAEHYDQDAAERLAAKTWNL